MSNTHLTENAQVFKHFTCDRHLLQEGTQKKGKDKITGVEEPHRHFMRLDERLHNRDELLEEKQVFIHLTIAADERPQQLRVSENEQANVANSGDSSKLVELVEEGFGRGSKNGAKLTDICHLKVVRPEQIDALSSKEIAAQKRSLFWTMSIHLRSRDSVTIIESQRDSGIPIASSVSRYNRSISFGSSGLWWVSWIQRRTLLI